MIRSFADRRTRDVAEGRQPRDLPQAILKTARRKPGFLNAATSLDALKVPPGNRLHPLVRDRAGQHAIWINDQYRVCFRWTEAGPEDVEIVDYHRAFEERVMPNQTDLETKVDAPIVLPPLHPGEVLREEFMVPLNLTAYAIAKACGVPRTRIERIAREEIGITADTALRLGRYFWLDARVWLNLQTAFDVETARRAMGDTVDRITPLARDAA